MLYKWNNENRLESLTIEGEKEIIFLKTEIETVEVFIKNDDIDKVIVHKNYSDEVVINKNQRKHIVVGDGNTKRDVYHYLKPDGPAKYLRLGITKHCSSGTWSSLPHKFELETELGFEEAFFYLLKGTSQRAIQTGKGVWPDGTEVDKVWYVYDRSFSSIPMGYHALVGEPGVYVSYIWAYLAKKNRWEKI